MIENALWEGLSTRCRTKFAVEAERFHDREVSLDSEHGCTRPLLLAEDLATTLVKHAVDTAYSVLRTLDFD